MPPKRGRPRSRSFNRDGKTPVDKQHRSKGPVHSPRATNVLAETCPDVPVTRSVAESLPPTLVHYVDDIVKKVTDVNKFIGADGSCGGTQLAREGRYNVHASRLQQMSQSTLLIELI